MFNITDLIYRIPDFLTDSECNLLISEYESRYSESDFEQCQDSNTGILTEASFSRVLLKEGTESYDLVFKKTEEAINHYIEYLNSFDSFHIPALKGSMLYSHVYRLLKYEVGSKIHPHSDHDPWTYASITFNLNDNYTGGAFKFFNGKHEVHLKKGEMMIWPADYFWVHEVAPIETGFRYSTNSFLMTIPQEIKNQLYKTLDEIFYFNENKEKFPKEYVIK